MTSVPVLGDFLRAAWRELDDRDGRAGTGAPGRDVAETADSVRRFVAVAARHVTDVIGAFGLMNANDRLRHRVWPQAAPDMLAALSGAAAALGSAEPAGGFQEERACELARRVDAAAASLAVGRDLLGTHFTGLQRGWGHRSGWAPVIASPAVGQALAADVGALIGRVAQAAGWLADSARGSDAGRRLAAGCQWLGQAAATARAARELQAVPDIDRELLYAIPASALPRQPALSAGMSAAELCAAVTATAQRAGHAAWLAAGLPGGSPEISVTSWRQIAAAGLAVSDHIALVLDGLASRAEELGQSPDSLWLAGAERSARLGQRWWQASARQLDAVTTDVRGCVSPAAAEAGNLAAVTGRLAFAVDPGDLPGLQSWPPRPGARLAPAREDIHRVVAAVHHAADSLARLAEASHAQARVAARAGRVLAPVPVPGLPHGEHGPFAPLAPDRTARMLQAFADVRAASAGTAGSVGAIAVITGAPSRYLAAARRAAGARRSSALSPWKEAQALAQVSPSGAEPAQRLTEPRRQGVVAAGPLEARVRELGAKGRFVARASSLDRQGRELLAEAATELLSLPAPAPARTRPKREGLLAPPQRAARSRGPRRAQRAGSAGAEPEAGQ